MVPAGSSTTITVTGSGAVTSTSGDWARLSVKGYVWRYKIDLAEDEKSGTVKQDMRDNYPFGMFAVPREQVVRVHASSGTTGKPTVVPPGMKLEGAAH